MATAALLFLSQITLWTKKESLHVLHSPIFSIILQNTLACSLSIDSTRFVKFMLLQATERGEKNTPKPTTQPNVPENKAMITVSFSLPSNQTFKMNSPKETKLKKCSIIPKIPTKVFLPSCEHLSVLHSSKKLLKDRGKWRNKDPGERMHSNRKQKINLTKSVMKQFGIPPPYLLPQNMR